VDCSGKQLVRAPEWSGTASYQHTFQIAGYGELTAGADIQFASSAYLGIEFLRTMRQDAYAIGNVDVTYTPESRRWSLSGFVDNVTDEKVMSAANRYPFVTAANPRADPLGVILASVRPPRTYGARLRVNF
jgi:iron complex outermembrane receptor protein